MQSRVVEQYLWLERTRECDYIGLSLQVRASLHALLSTGLLAFYCQDNFYIYKVQML